MILKLKAKDFALGDDVKLFDGAFGWGKVVELTGATAKVFRPYVYLDSITGIDYIGTEGVNLWTDSARIFEVERSKYV